MTSYTQTLRDKLMKDKNAGMKKTIEIIQENTYEKKNTKRTKSEALKFNQETKLNSTLQRTELEPNTRISRTRSNVQWLRKEGPLRESL